MALINCPECSRRISSLAASCPNCGQPMLVTPSAGAVIRQSTQPRWNARVAALLSLVLPGAGQMYKGQLGNGIAWLIFVPICYAASVGLGLLLHLVCIIGAATGNPVVKKKTGCLGYIGAAFLIFSVAIGFLVFRSGSGPNRARSSSASTGLASDAAIVRAIEDSDDFQEHEEAFITASKRLIEEGRCSLDALKYNGGWVRSQRYQEGTVYFTYRVGRGATVRDRIYLNANTGELFQ